MVDMLGRHVQLIIDEFFRVSVLVNSGDDFVERLVADDNLFIFFVIVVFPVSLRLNRN